MSKIRNLGQTAGGIGVLIVAIIAINIIAGRLYARLDVTDDRIFSLTDGTKKILDKLDRDVTAKLYFSRSNKELPVVIKTYATRVEEVLKEYRSRSGDKIAVEVIDPQPDTAEEEQAQRYGINGVSLPKGDQAYFGVVLVSGAKEIAIPYLDPRREELLEYDLSEALVGLFRQDKPKIGVMSSLPVMGTNFDIRGDENDPWILIQSLRRNFSVEKIETDVKEIAADIKVLLLIHPKNLSEATLFAIDQFVLRGGRVVAALDPMSRTDLQAEAAKAQMTGQAPELSSDLAKLLTAWGVEFDKSKIVGDLSRATQINAGGVGVVYPFFMSLNETAFAPNSVITNNLKQMLFAEGGSFKQISGSTFDFEPLVNTTKDSGTIASQMAGYSSPQDLALQFKSDGADRVLAALVRGKFKSAFPGGAPKADGQAPGTSGAAKLEAAQEASIVLIGDVDFLTDQNSAEKMRFGNQIMIRTRNDNLNLILNAVDFLGGSEELISIRSKGRIARPFTRVAELEKNAQQRFQTEEEKLKSQLNELQTRLNQLQQQRTDGNRLVLTQDQQGEIQKFRDDEANVRRRLREVRKSLREDIERLGRNLIAANMLIVPALATSVGGFVFASRARRRKESKRGGAS